MKQGSVLLIFLFVVYLVVLCDARPCNMRRWHMCRDLTKQVAQPPKKTFSMSSGKTIFFFFFFGGNIFKGNVLSI